MATVVVEKTVDEAGLRALLEPQDTVVAEQRVADGRFELAEGPFDHYVRTVEHRPGPNGTFEVTETTDFTLAIPVWGWMFKGLVKRTIRKPPAEGKKPWWSPPDLMDARASRTLSYLCVFSAITGYLGTLLTQTNTYFREDFGLKTSEVSWVLTGVRVAGLLALVYMAIADRKGRRRVLLFVTYAAILLAATGAFAPNLAWLGISQTLARSFSAAIALLIPIIAVEEMPAGSRAFSVSVLVMSGALGAGGVVLFLGLADLAPWAWRVFFLVPLLLLPAVVHLGRRLPESRRFEVYEMHELLGAANLGGADLAGPGLTVTDRVDTSDGATGSSDPTRSAPDADPNARSPRWVHVARFALLASVGFITAMFAVPASQYLNDYLKTEQGFSGVKISFFQVLTTLPGGISIVAGGRLADVFGRRVIGAIGVGGGTLFTVLMFTNSGWPIWVFSTIGTVIAAMAVPALGVYGPELFPTKARGLANGGINLVQVLGAVIGLWVVGFSHDATDSYSSSMALLGLGGIIVVGIILFLYPETAHRELEDINPEDAPPPASSKGLAELEHELDEALEHQHASRHDHDHGPGRGPTGGGTVSGAAADTIDRRA